MKNTFVYNNHLEAKKVLSTLESELEMCDEFIFSVAFISESGLTSLLQTLKNLEEKNKEAAKFSCLFILGEIVIWIKIRNV